MIIYNIADAVFWVLLLLTAWRVALMPVRKYDHKIDSKKPPLL